jgi:hypothetical protein
MLQSLTDTVNESFRHSDFTIPPGCFTEIDLEDTVEFLEMLVRAHGVDDWVAEPGMGGRSRPYP